MIYCVSEVCYGGRLIELFILTFHGINTFYLTSFLEGKVPYLTVQSYADLHQSKPIKIILTEVTLLHCRTTQVDRNIRWNWIQNKESRINHLNSIQSLEVTGA